MSIPIHTLLKANVYGKYRLASFSEFNTDNREKPNCIVSLEEKLNLTAEHLKTKPTQYKQKKLKVIAIAALHLFSTGIMLPLDIEFRLRRSDRACEIERCTRNSASNNLS